MTTLYITTIADWDPSPEVYQRLVESLDEPSQTRIARYRQRSDRLRFLAGRLLLRRHVSLIDPGNRSPLQLAYSDFGKPTLTSPRYALDFNISHDDEVVMLAATSASPPLRIGIDVMRVNRSGSDADGLEEVLLEQTHPKELATFRRTFGTSDETSRLDYLIRMWTVKEAYTKAIGTGLGTEFTSLCVDGLETLHKECTSTSPSVTPSRIAIRQSLTCPSLAPPISSAWTVRHGSLFVSPTVSANPDGQDKRFAWSFVSAAPGSGSDGPIDFRIVECRDLETVAA